MILFEEMLEKNPDTHEHSANDRSPRRLMAAGILRRHAKGKPDLEAEQMAIEEAMIGKYLQR